MREANGEPIVGFRDVKEYTMYFPVFIILLPALTLPCVVRHYWNEVKYLSFHNVDE